MTQPLPRQLDEITPAWVSEALAARYPGTVVTELHFGAVISGTATKIRLLLSYNEAGHAHALPPTMWLKGGFIRHGHTYDEFFRAEAEFYGQWAPELSINIAQCFYAERDDVQGLVLLEDLLARNVKFGRPTVPISIEQERQTIEQLAKVHAKWWQSPRLEPLNSFRTFYEASGGLFDQMLIPEYYQKCLDSPRGATVTGRYRDPATMGLALRAQWRRSVEVPQCFIHGDPHLGNMFFERDGRPGFLDWQQWLSGPYIHDIAYSMIGNLSVADRRHAERDLLAHYRECLIENGVVAPPAFEEMFEAYRRHAMHGFMWFTCPVEMQPDDLCVAEGERFGTAVSDLDTLGSLGV